jgi:hypothetical protein
MELPLLLVQDQVFRHDTTYRNFLSSIQTPHGTEISLNWLICTIHIFIYGSFEDNASNSEYVASSDKMIGE